MNRIYLLISSLLIALTFQVYAQADQKNVAKVLILKGTAVEVKADGKTVTLAKDMWIDEGSTVKTEAKSFAKLIFIDKSQMNLGPSSEMVISKFPKNEAGIIGLMKGQLRSKVTKNYMDDADKDKSKLFIKTKSAAMGVRGTDFNVGFDPSTNATALDVISGEVAMVKSVGDLVDTRSLDQALNSPEAASVGAGYSSSVGEGSAKPEVVPMPADKLDTMKKNDVPMETTSEAKSESKEAKPADKTAETKKEDSKEEKKEDSKEEKKETAAAPAGNAAGAAAAKAPGTPGAPAGTPAAAGTAPANATAGATTAKTTGAPGAPSGAPTTAGTVPANTAAGAANIKAPMTGAPANAPATAAAPSAAPANTTAPTVPTTVAAPVSAPTQEFRNPLQLPGVSQSALANEAKVASAFTGSLGSSAGQAVVQQGNQSLISQGAMTASGQVLPSAVAGNNSGSISAGSDAGRGPASVGAPPAGGPAGAPPAAGANAAGTAGGASASAAPGAATAANMPAMPVMPPIHVDLNSIANETMRINVVNAQKAATEALNNTLIFSTINNASTNTNVNFNISAQ